MSWQHEAYARLLQLYPAPFRFEFGEEMAQVFAALQAEAARNGRWALTRLWLRELTTLPANLLREYRHPLQESPPMSIPLSFAKQRCSRCTAVAPPEARFCPACGRRLKPPPLPARLMAGLGWAGLLLYGLAVGAIITEGIYLLPSYLSLLPIVGGGMLLSGRAWPRLQKSGWIPLLRLGLLLALSLALPLLLDELLLSLLQFSQRTASLTLPGLQMEVSGQANGGLHLSRYQNAPYGGYALITTCSAACLAWLGATTSQLKSKRLQS